MLVLLVPDVVSSDLIAETFLGIPEILKELDQPSISLTSTFAGLDDMTPYEVSDDDRHPNAEGHKRLFEHLYRQLEADPALMAMLAGTPNGSR
jgi:hypothetical protein